MEIRHIMPIHIGQYFSFESVLLLAMLAPQILHQRGRTIHFNKTEMKIYFLHDGLN